MKNILVLFPNDWDKVEFSKKKYKDKYNFQYFGPNLFKFPGLLRLPFFNVNSFISDVIKTVEREGFDAVLSSDEYIGAIIAAVVSSKCDLNGFDPSKIVLSQHKYYSRLAQMEHCPEAAVSCQLIDQKLSSNYKSELPFPFFVKPVKGTFSLFAKKVNDFAELKKHMAFSWYEWIFLKAITRPFNQLLEKNTKLENDANFFVGEELIEGVQVTVDGFAWKGEVTICGIVDSIMFPDSNIFERFEYPSKLDQRIQERMQDVVKKFIQGIGFQNAQFNVELFYNHQEDSIHIIEINPRLSYQFGDLYENVDGTNTYQILIDLALGSKPAFLKDNGMFKCTASFVLRTFLGKRLASVPDYEHIKNFNRKYPESNIRVYGKTGTKLSNEMRAIGSYRYGIVNVGAHSLLDLFSIYEDVVDNLPFTFK